MFYINVLLVRTNVISKFNGERIEKIEVSRPKWKLIVWTPIIIGAIIFSIFSSTFYIPKEYMRAAATSGLGMILIGWGFGLAYARAWRIDEIDN